MKLRKIYSSHEILRRVDGAKGITLEGPIQLTPDQIELVAAAGTEPDNGPTTRGGRVAPRLDSSCGKNS